MNLATRAVDQFKVTCVFAQLRLASPAIPAQTQLMNTSPPIGFIALVSAALLSLGGNQTHAQVAELENLAFAPGGLTPASSEAYLSNSTSGRQVSANGRWVAFRSNAANMTPSTPIGFGQIFVLDRFLRTIEVISRAAGAQTGANGHSLTPHISADGRFVAYYSEASNLVPDDTNGVADLFVTDRVTGVTKRVSVASGNVQLSESCSQVTISGDGRTISFSCGDPLLAPAATGPYFGVFIHELETGLTSLITQTESGVPINGASIHPSLSFSGRYVAFESSSTQLDPTFIGASSVYRYDRQTRQFVTVSVNQGIAAGGGGPSISYDGQRIAFGSSSALAPTDLSPFADVYVRDLTTQTTFHISATYNGLPSDSSSYQGTIAGDGKSVAFISNASNLTATGHNGTADVYWREVEGGQLLRLAQNRAGEQGNDQAMFPSMGGDHRTVVFNNRSLNWTPDVGPAPLFSSVYAAQPRTDQISALDMEAP